MAFLRGWLLGKWDFWLYIYMKKCKVKWCNKNQKTIGYCSKHYKQFYRHGIIFERTKFDPNEIICKGKICEIVLYTGKSNQKEIARTFIDKKFINKVKKYKWSVRSSGYVYAHYNKNKNIQLHRLIIGKVSKGLVVDHKNENPLDNRIANLRVATHSQNHSNNSKIKGYHYDKLRNKFYVSIKKESKSIYIGRFDTESEAKQARLAAEKKYLDKFAPKR